ncbi:MAG TPA: GxxExxY protein [Blastocatellia bacterium]|nr:GxxExxY protein [Blastocatellia bacterium]
MNDNQIARETVDAAVQVHKRLGPGLLESVYKSVMAHELTKRGLSVIRERAVPVVYDSIRLDVGFRVDLLVNLRLVVELKSVEAIAPVHIMQVVTYLRLMDLRLGLLLNFGAPLMKDGIRRVVNNFVEE